MEYSFKVEEGKSIYYIGNRNWSFGGMYGGFRIKKFLRKV